MRTKFRIWTWLFIIIIIVVVGVLVLSGRDNDAPAYETAVVDRGLVRKTVSVTGTVTSAEQVQLSLKQSARIASVAVRVGDTVAAGQELVASESSDAENQARQAESNYNAAKATLAKMQSGAGSEEVNVAQVQVDNAQKSLAAANARLANVRKTTTEDISSAKLQVTNAESQLVAAQRAFADVQASNAQKVSNAQTAVTNADIDAKNAATALEDTIDTNAQTITSAETALDNAETYLSSAQDYLEGVEDDYDDGLATSSQVQSASLTVTSAQNSRNAAQDALATAQAQAESFENAAKAKRDVGENAYETAQDVLASVQLETKILENNASAEVDRASVALLIAGQALRSAMAQAEYAQQNAESDVESASGALDAARANLELVRKGARDVDLKPQEAVVEQAQAAYELAMQRLDDTKVISPINGVVTKIDTKVGEFAAAGVPVVALLGLDELTIEANVPETDIARITSGIPVEITFDAFGTDEQMLGTIKEIDPDSTVIQGVIYYKVTIGLAQEDPRIRSGMTANVDIVIQELSDVVRIPLRAMKRGKGYMYVLVPSASGAVEKRIVIGLEGDTYAEVQNGLQEGASVITYEPKQ